MDEKLVKYIPHAHARCSVTFGVSVTEHEIIPLTTNVDLHDKFDLTYHVDSKLGFSLYYLIYIANFGIATFSVIQTKYKEVVPMERSLVKIRVCYDAKGNIPNDVGLKVKNTLCTLLGTQSIKHARIFDPVQFSSIHHAKLEPNTRHTDKILLWGRTVMFALGMGPYGWDACTLLKTLPARLRNADVSLMDDTMRFALDDAAKKAQYSGIDDILHGGAGWWFMGYRIVDIDVHAHLRATSQNPLGVAELLRLHNNKLALHIYPDPPPSAELLKKANEILASWAMPDDSKSGSESGSERLKGGLERIHLSSFPHIIQKSATGIKVSKVKDGKVYKVNLETEPLVEFEKARIFNGGTEMTYDELLTSVNNGNVYKATSHADGVEVKQVPLYGVTMEDDEPDDAPVDAPVDTPNSDISDYAAQGGTAGSDGLSEEVAQQPTLERMESIISVHGGKMEAYKVDLGKETDYLVKTLMLRLKHNKKNLFGELSDALVEELLRLPTDKFIYKFMNINKMTWIYALATRPLFFEIVHWLEGLISRACKERDFDVEGNLIKWKRIDREEEIDSSSILLYRFDEIAEKIGFEYSGEFKYPGFCPWEPDVRLRKLLEFPLVEWLEWLERYFKSEMIDIQIQLDDMKEFIKKIVVVPPPTFIKIAPIKAKKPIRELLLDKVLVQQVNLKLWEDYLVAWTKIMSSVTARWMTTVVAQTLRVFN